MISILQKLFKRKSILDYWEKRATQLGERSPININSNLSVDSLTKIQESILFPYLLKYLNGSEKKVLDFGCGTGRFTKRLKNYQDFNFSSVIGIDPIGVHIEIATSNDASCEYYICKDSKIQFPDNYFDLIWINLVIGGIPKNEIKKTLKELNRVLRIDGLIFLVENTTQLEDSSYWTYRDENYFINIFDFVNLDKITEFEEFKEQFTVFTGRKNK